MIIDVVRTNSVSGCKEALNISSQYRALVKDPAMKLKDSFKERIICIYISIVVLVALLAATFIFWKVSALTIVAAVILGLAAVFGVMIHLGMKKMIRQYMEDKSKRQIALDEKGIEIRKDGAAVVRLEWSNVAALRLFDETFCVIAKTVSGPAMIINRTYLEEVKGYIETETDAKIEYIGN